jgi:putative ABC transport system permease protein
MTRWFEQFLQDVRFGVRSLSASPGFSASAILSLALGIGASTAIFSVIHGVIIDPFPYSHPETLLSFYATVPGKSIYYSPFTPDGYVEVQERTHAFSDLIASSISDVSWTGAGEPQRLRGNICTFNTFEVMGVKPLIGRAITISDGKPEAEPVTLLGYKFWMRQFGGDPSVIGRKLRLNDQIRTVIGVMPKRFMWRGADVYLPVNLRRGQPLEDAPYIFIMGRLKPGATQAQAAAELSPVLSDLMLRDSGERPPKLQVVIQDFYETFPSDIRHSLWILFGAVGVLLVIACANVSSLLLARSAARSREMAVRLSLGAGRFRLIRQLLTESGLIGLSAGLLGVLLAVLSLRSILAIVPPNTIPDESDVSLSMPVLLFTLLVSLGAAFFFGLAPALQAGRSQVAGALKDGGRAISGVFGEARIRNAFVVLEVALAMMLLVSASLVVRTLLHLERVEIGAQPEQTLTMTIPLSDKRYPTRERRNAFYLDLLERAARIPGIKAVALNQSVHPFVYFGTNAVVPASSITSKTRVVVSQVSAQYPQLVNNKLLQGRLLTPDDVRAARSVTVVNQKFASYFFPQGNALGQHVQLLGIRPRTDANPDQTSEIVGIVNDLPNVGLTREIVPEAYIPFTSAGYQRLSATLLVVGAGLPSTFVKPVQQQIRAIDPQQPIMEVRTLKEWLDLRGYSEPRFSVFLFGVFSSLGLLLAALGIFAVMNFSVLRQTREIGVRMALGAQRALILKMVVGSGARLLAIGAVLGLLGSLGVTRFLRGMISGVSPFDPLSFAIVLVVVFAIGLLACLRPALRAAGIDPMTALRQE